MSVPALLAAKGSKQVVDTTAEKITGVLKGDIVRLKGELFREVTVKMGKKKETKLVPIEYDFRINALSVALATGGLAAAVLLIGFALWWSQLRIGKMSDEDRVKLETELGTIPFSGWVGAEFQVLKALKDIQETGVVRADRRAAMRTLIDNTLKRPDLDVNLKSLQLLLKFIQKNIKRIERSLRLGVKLDERQGFRIPGGVSLIG
jgi:hypothetical protein